MISTTATITQAIPQVATVVLVLVFFTGIFTIIRQILHLIDWVSKKLYDFVYGPPIEPYHLFKIEGWEYKPWQVTDRLERK